MTNGAQSRGFASSSDRAASIIASMDCCRASAWESFGSRELAAEYRAYAEKCIESAKSAHSQQDRGGLLEMATVQKPTKPGPR
jgi:hypothetical protein